MADRDVNLIIRAKNQASATIDSVADALKVLTDAQEKVAGSGGKTNSAMAQLGDELAKMNAKVSGMQAMSKLAGILERTRGGIVSLQNGVADAASKFAAYSSSADQARNSVVALEQQQASLIARIGQEKAARDEARKELNKTSAAQKELTSAQSAYNKALKIKPDVEGRDDTIAAAKARLDQATAAVAGYRLAYDGLAATYKASGKELTALNGKLREAKNSQAQFQSLADKATATMQEQSASLAKGEAEFGELDAKVKQAAQGFGIIGQEQSELSANTAKLLPQIAKLSALFGSMQRYSTGTSGFVDPKTAAQLQRLGGEAKAVETSWRALEAEAGRLAREMRAVEQPTQEQVTAFRQVVAAAGAAKAEHRELQVAMGALRSTTKTTAAEFINSLNPLTAHNAALKKARAETEALAEAQRKQASAVDSAVGRYSSGTGTMVDAKVAAQMREQAQAVEQARVRWEALRNEAARLQGVMQSGGSATAAQSQRFRDVAAAANLAEKEFREASVALQQMGARGNADIFGKLNRESRQAMSVFQRMRGEVLSLATAYVGLYGTISNTGNVIAAYQTLEAAQNRLGAVFAQDDNKVAQELNFLERQASRLGIEFGTLAGQYSKFAVSAQAANFTSEATRKIFMSVAEAGRVNKLSLDDMNGVFLALTQMIQKGRISSEELRQQLAERLPGGVQIMADALGVTTAQLSKMMEQGEVLATQSNLLKFADQLEKRFGPQLSKSLESTTTQIGRFWNSIYQAQLQVAKGGFIDAFNDMLKEMNDWFQTREGRDFFLSLGAAAGTAMDGLKVIVQNIEPLLKLFSALIALKVSAWLTGIVNGSIAAARNMAVLAASSTQVATAQTVATASTTRFGASLTAGGASALTFANSLFTVSGRAALTSQATLLATTAMTTFTTRAGLAAVGSRALAASMGVVAAAGRALSVALAAMGGPVGLLITLGTIIGGSMLANWATGVDGATQALDEHQRIMGEVITAYDEVRGKTEDWSKALKNVTLDEANASLRKMAEEYEKFRAASLTLSNIDTVSVGGLTGGFDSEVRSAVRQLQDLGNRMADNKVTAKEYRAELEAMYRATKSDRVRQFLETLLDTARAGEQAADAYALSAETAQKLGSNIDEVSAGLAASTTRIQDAAEAADNGAKSFEDAGKGADAFAAGLDKIKEKIPELGTELKQLKQLAEVEVAFAEAVAGIDGRFRSAGALYAQAEALRNQAINSINQSTITASGPNGSFIDRLIGIESGGNANAKNQNSTATGLGQFIESTWLRMFKQYFPDRAAGMSNEMILALRKDAEISKSMIELYARENAAVLQKAGVALTDASLYLAHFLGPGGATDLMKAAPGTAVKDILGADQINANAGILDGKTREEVIAWAERKMGITKAEQSVLTQMDKLEEDRLEKVKKETEEKAKAAAREAAELAKKQAQTSQELSDLGFDNEMLQKKLAGKEREVFIEEELRRLRQQNPAVTDAEIQKATELLGKKYDLQKALTAEKDEKKQIREVEEQINNLETQRNALLAQRKIYEEQGNTEKVQEVDGQIAGLNTQLQAAISNAITLMQALGGPGADAAIAKMKTLGVEIANTDQGGQKFAYTAKQMSDNVYNGLSNGIVGMFQSFAQAVANGEDAVSSLKDAFLQFASNFLLEIAAMILKQALFNSLQAVSAALGGGLFGMFHTGGVVGMTNGSQKYVSPAWFNNAVRYHTGGIAGLAPDEVPAILRVGEEVLTEDDPRHRANGGTGGAGPSTRVINMFDAPSFLSEALNSKLGEETILNFVRANPGAFKAALG